MSDQSPFWKPKFTIAAFILLVAAAALFTKLMDQGGFITLATLIFSGFAAASVVENKIVPPPTGKQ